MNRTSRQDLFWGGLPRKLHLARQIYTQFGPQLLATTSVREQLALLASRVAEVAAVMQAARLPELCRVCAEGSASGGCCSLAMADESDAILLLANLLAGHQVGVRREDGRECPFLGPTGCTLGFKPIFCLNYLCQRIRQSVTTGEQQALDLSVGLLLQGQCRIEEMLVAFLHSRGCIA